MMNQHVTVRMTPTTKAFSVKLKKSIASNTSDKQVTFFSNLLTDNFSMSEELAKAIGTVVVQALTENAKDDISSGGSNDMLDINDDAEFDLGSDEENGGDNELPLSKRAKGEVEEAEGPKAAPDLSKEFEELKSTTSNHSYVNSINKSKVVTMSEADRYRFVKDFFNNDI